MTSPPSDGSEDKEGRMELLDSRPARLIEESVRQNGCIGSSQRVTKEIGSGQMEVIEGVSYRYLSNKQY